jgi:Uma2 family endonuclease
MAEAGVLTENDRVELIEGEIIQMCPIGSRHAACVRRAGDLLTRLLAQVVIVSVQNPVHISEYSEPLPDIALLKPRDDFYSRAHPNPEDILLVIEMADTSVDYDREIKIPLYAKAGIPEAWLVNLPKDIIEVYTEPLNGSYQKCRLVSRGEILTTKVLANLTINVDDILG